MAPSSHPAAADTAPLARLRAIAAYYECPKDAAGRRRGPLVGYAGRDPHGRQYVGDIYINFARAERHPALLADFSRALRAKLDAAGLGEALRGATGFCGAPEGGKAFAYQLALDAGRLYLYPEKKITALASAAARERSELVFNRHEPELGQSWFIVEDVCNNFSTTAKLVATIESYGASVAGVVCFLNRSPTVGSVYRPRPGLDLPVVAVVHKVFAQYAQDDAAVVADIAAGNVVWSPKGDWPRLERAMAQGDA